MVDKWNNRSIGGMNYFVAHPGGRSYDTFPINSYEAQSRRINRFWDFNHTQGDITPFASSVVEQMVDINGAKRATLAHNEEKVFVYESLPISIEYPHTLDLRRKKR